MVIVNLMGGLGNQLFQYAAGRALSLHHQTELKFIFEDHYNLAKRVVKIQHFNIAGQFLKNGEAKDFFPRRRVKRRIFKFFNLPYEGKIYREQYSFDFDNNLFCLPPDVLLYGMWQSHQYLSSIESLLYKELTLRAPSERFKVAKENIKALENPVSFHVRRGDYTNKKSGFVPLTREYYEKANAHFKASVQPFTPVIFTDDIEWVKEALAFPYKPVFVSTFGLEDFEELSLMSACSHHVIANSTFSWWGAWLNPNKNKSVVAPEHWHVLHTENSTLIPDSWIKLS